MKIASLANQSPSSCNRQSCKIHIITNKSRLKSVLKVQGGCTGFGHLASAVIIVTSDLYAFYDLQERSQCYINAGFFAMNILYALHEEQIGACVLNWSNTTKKDKLMRSLVSTIKPSEQICCLISCGYTPEEFDVTLSKRKDVADCIFFVDRIDHEHETIFKKQ